MLYLSQIQNQPIWDSFGRPVGRCKDILIENVERPFPVILALAVQDGDATPQFIPATQVSALFPSITLGVPIDRVRAYSATGGELWLAAES